MSGIEEFFSVQPNCKPEYSKVEMADDKLICRFYEAADIEGNASFELSRDGRAVITLPRPAVINRNDMYYLRARAMYRMVLHNTLKNELPEGVAWRAQLHPKLAESVILMAQERDQDGQLYLYVVPQIPVRITQYFPVAVISFSKEVSDENVQPDENDSDKDKAPKEPSKEPDADKDKAPKEDKDNDQNNADAKRIRRNRGAVKDNEK